MDNGTRSLSRLINKTVPYLKKIKNIKFYVCIDHLEEKSKNEIFTSKNIVPVSGLKKMHEKVDVKFKYYINYPDLNRRMDCWVH